MAQQLQSSPYYYQCVASLYILKRETVHMMDKYCNFSELQKCEKRGKDYTILCREAATRIAILAPHGGGIEPGTIDIADAIAGSDYSFYAFKGTKKTGNAVLHITSNRYDEPIGVKTAERASVVITIHGSRAKEELVYIGGKHHELKQKIQNSLSRAGFGAVISEMPGLRGISPNNICNRCKNGRGVQLEISRGLREKMFDNLDRRSWRKRTVVFCKFVTVIKKVLRYHEREKHLMFKREESRMF